MKTRLRLLIAITIMASLNIVNAASHSAFVNVMHETVESVLASAVQVTAGDEHTCALTITGGVKCWGSNYWGALGDGTTTDRITPVDVIGLTSGVSQITAAGSHTCAVTNTGGAKCWGSNYWGGLGDGTTNSQTIPVDVIGLTSGVSYITTGDSHTCVVTNTGGAKCWGYNFGGRLGDGTTNSRMTPVDVSGLTSGVSQITAGASHTCAVTNTGGAKCWGYNLFGALGDGTDHPRATPVDVLGLTSGVSQITAGDSHTCAVTNTGGAKCWGYNFLGELGDGTRNSRMTPVDVSGLTNGVIAVRIGNVHTCAVTNTGGAKCWGANLSGELGDGTRNDRITPVDVSGLTSGVNTIGLGYGGHTCAVMNTGGVKCWGENRLGKLGDGTRNDRITPVDVIGLNGGFITPTTPAPTTPAPTTPAPTTPAPTTPVTNPCVAPPIETLTFTPPSSSIVGTVVQVSARATSNACFRAMRLRINGQIVNETGSPTLTYNWNTTGYSASGHQVIVEVAAQGDNSWAAPSNRGAIYVLSLPLTTPSPTTTPAPTTPTPISQLDSDGDGIPDDIEVNGYDYDGDGIIDLNLTNLGAKPNHKDIFVYIDWFVHSKIDSQWLAHQRNTHKPSDHEIDRMKKAFANAPITNTDGIPGINLVVVFGREIEEDETNMVLGKLTPDTPECRYVWNDFDDLKYKGRQPQMFNVFHYAISAHDLPKCPSGFQPGGVSKEFTKGAGDFVVGHGLVWQNFFDPDMYQFALVSAIMHELGHNLGLGHGGLILDDHDNVIKPDDVNNKPNHLSIMNYSFPNGLRKKIGVTEVGIPVFRDWFLDYSRFDESDLPDLDENKLNEVNGMNPSDRVKDYGTVYYCSKSGELKKIDGLQQSINWNCNENKTEISVTTDINNDKLINGQDGKLLRTVNEWKYLQFKGGAIGAFGQSVDLFTTTSSPMLPEISFEEFVRITQIAVKPHDIYLPLLKH